MTDTSQLNDALAANYMLVDLDVKSWSGNKTDREASSELIAAKGATKDSGRFVKYLFASADAELQEVRRGNEIGTISFFVLNYQLGHGQFAGELKHGDHERKGRRHAEVAFTEQARQDHVAHKGGPISHPLREGQDKGSLQNS